MNVLIIDTSTPLEMVIAHSGMGTHDIIKPVDFSHSITLFENIDLCLKSAGITINDIELIGTGIGPGSFTGIRIGISTARMLAQVTGAALVGIKTQLIYAASVPACENDNILIAFDAKKKKVFGALYKKTASLLPEEIVPPGDYPIESLLKSIGQQDKTLAIGDGIEKYYDQVEKSGINHTFLKDVNFDREAIIKLFINTYQSSPDSYRDYNITVPFYSRKSDAEIAKEAADNRSNT